MSDPLDILDVIASSDVTFSMFGTKPDCKKYHDFTVLRNHIKLYIKQYEHGADVHAIYKINMEVSLHDYRLAEKLVDTPKKAAELQESIEKHTQSGMLQEVIRMHTLL